MARELRKQRTEGSESSDRVSMSRRNYMTVAGTAASTLGYLGLSAGRASAADLSSVEYGYGGTPILSDGTAMTEQESNDTIDTATQISLGVGVSGTLDSGEADWFEFDATRGWTLDATFDLDSDASSAALVLYGPGKRYLGFEYVTGGSPAEFSATVPETGTYYAQALDTGSGAGGYELRVESEDAPAANVEPQTYGQYGYGGVEA